MYPPRVDSCLIDCSHETRQARIARGIPGVEDVSSREIAKDAFFVVHSANLLSILIKIF
jgi:hypothetical protein